MGKREEVLKDLLVRKFGCRKHSKPKKSDVICSQYNDEISLIYSGLGGVLNEYPTEYRGFDIQCADFVVELDEERHFNRYRFLTLNSKFYENCRYFDVSVYKELCQSKEKECLKAAGWRKNWKSDSTIKQFGMGDSEGQLGNNGSPRWKQRAFYDYLRDISSEIMNVPIIRISIWESIDDMTVDSLIKMNRMGKILDLILERKGVAA